MKCSWCKEEGHNIRTCEKKAEQDEYWALVKHAEGW